MSEPVRGDVSMADGAVSCLEWKSDAPLLHFAHATGFNANTYRGLLSPLAGAFRMVASVLVLKFAISAEQWLSESFQRLADDFCPFLIQRTSDSGH